MPTAAKPRKATTAKKATEPAVEPTEVLPPALSAVPDPESDVADDTDVPEGAVRVPFGDSHVWVLDPDDWPTSADEALMDRRFNAWASKALARDRDVALWLSVDPTKRVVNEFFGEWAKVRGVSVDDPKATRRAMLSLAQ